MCFRFVSEMDAAVSRLLTVFLTLNVRHATSGGALKPLVCIALGTAVDSLLQTGKVPGNDGTSHNDL